MRIGFLEVVQEEDGSLEDTKKTLYLLKERQRAQAKITLAWKTRFREENKTVSKLKKERDDYLKTIQSQLLVFESSLKKTRKEMENVVQHKDGIIRRQNQLICSLSLALVKRGGNEDLRKILPGIKVERSPSEVSTNNNYKSEQKNNSINENETRMENEKHESDFIMTSSKSDVESLNDSDSAIMMEDAYDSIVVLPVGKGEVKVMRSVSDALEIITRSSSSSSNNINSNNKPTQICQTTVRRTGHGSLSSTPSCSSESSDESPPSTMNKGRNDILRHVYTVDEEVHSNAANSNSINSNICGTCISSEIPLFISHISPTCQSLHCCNNITNPRNCQSTPCTSKICTFVTPCQSCVPSQCHSCQIRTCHSPCQSCNSASTTPLVSPAQSPTLSPSSSPVLCPQNTSVSSILKTNYNSNYDSDATLSDGESDTEEELGHLPDHFQKATSEKKSLFGSYEKLNLENSYAKKKPKDEIQVTYNRVMSNHRSVTKPKDVKYRRINKAKSRSLEELRGKLKLWDGKQSYSVDLGQSDA